MHLLPEEGVMLPSVFAANPVQQNDKVSCGVIVMLQMMVIVHNSNTDIPTQRPTLAQVSMFRAQLLSTIWAGTPFTRETVDKLMLCVKRRRLFRSSAYQ